MQLHTLRCEAVLRGENRPYSPVWPYVPRHASPLPACFAVQSLVEVPPAGSGGSLQEWPPGPGHPAVWDLRGASAGKTRHTDAAACFNANGAMPFSLYWDSAIAVCAPLLSVSSLLRNSRIRSCRRIFFFRSRSNLALSPFLPDIIASFVSPMRC